MKLLVQLIMPRETALGALGRHFGKGVGRGGDRKA